MNFRDKSVIVTGGASGIGAATALRFAREGARVAVADLRADAAERSLPQLRSAGASDAAAFGCDVSDERQVVDTVAKVLDRFGRLDVVVNNAGLMIFRPLEQVTTEDWQKTLGVDLLGAFYFLRESFLHMSRGGAVVNVSSVHAIETTPLVAPYATAKAALLSLTRSAAIEGTSRGIRVNAILPGAIDTPMLWNNPNVKSGAETLDPATVGKPEDVADAIAFLASAQARFVTGAALRVDGGRLSRL